MVDVRLLPCFRAQCSNASTQWGPFSGSFIGTEVTGNTIIAETNVRLRGASRERPANDCSAVHQAGNRNGWSDLGNRYAVVTRFSAHPD